MQNPIVIPPINQSVFTKARLIFHTVYCLRPLQLFARLWFRVYRPSVRERPTLAVRPVSSPWIKGASHPPSMIGSGSFLFLDEKGSLSGAEGWNDPGRDKLWLYNLHYFDDLNAAGAAERSAWHQALICRWIDENPPALGNGWEPYPLSLRIGNWIKWALQGNQMDEAWLSSLAMQARYLRGRLEYHLLGNHLFANAKALVFAGLYFSGQEAEEWLSKGLAILAREVPEQVLDDGGHFERSPMYHSIILVDLLDLMNLAGAYGLKTWSDTQVGSSCYVHSGPLLDGENPLSWQADRWMDAVQRMCFWLKTICHPDGETALFNDAAFGIAPGPAAILDYAKRLGVEINCGKLERMTCLAQSGYIRWQTAMAVMFLDVAPIGPDYLPGHGHADTLSFELSLYGSRVIVDSGTSCYGESRERLRQRGTKAHNTVTIDGCDSSEVWSGFRVARRAKPVDLVVDEGADGASVSCGHDGYRRLPGRPVHYREWRLQDESLSIKDVIKGAFRNAVSRFHFHPDVRVERERCVADKGRAVLPSCCVMTWEVRSGKASIVPSSYHPEFGVRLFSQCLEVSFAGPEAEIVFTWQKR